MEHTMGSQVVVDAVLIGVMTMVLAGSSPGGGGAAPSGVESPP